MGEPSIEEAAEVTNITEAPERTIEELDVDIAKTEKAIKQSLDILVPSKMESLRLSPREQSRIRKSVRNDNGLTLTLLENLEQEGLSKDKQLREHQLQSYLDWGKSMRTWKNKLDKLSSYDRRNMDKIGKLGQLENMRYALIDLERRTGVPLYKIHSSLEDNATRGGNEAYSILMEELKKIGMNPWNIAWYNVQDPLIAKALFEEDVVERQKLFDVLTEKQQLLFNAANNILQGPKAHAVRELRWWRWNRADLAAEETTNKKKKGSLTKEARRLRPPDIKDSDAIRLLEEGREAQKIGKLSEWIRTQTFGTRARYFMSEPISRTMEETILTPIEFKLGVEEGRALTSKELSELRTRKGESEVMQKPLLQALMYSLQRSLVANAIKDDFVVFQEAFQKTEPSDSDRVRMQTYMDNVIGTPQEAGIFVRSGEFLNRFFWRTFAMQVKKIGHYSFRNLAQMILATGQLSKAAAFESTVRLAGKRSELRAQAFAEDWENVTQKRSMQQEFMLLRETSTQIPTAEGKTLRKAASQKLGLLADAVGKLIPLSDEIDRRFSWPVFHQAAETAFKRYSKSKNFSWLRTYLFFDTLERPQQDRLRGFLEKGDIAEFAKLYARWKTENTFFKYTLKGRSLEEQKRAGRLLSGLINFPRGMVNVFYRNAIKPLKSGMVNAEGIRLYQGVAATISVWVAFRIAQELTYQLMGKRYRDDYSIYDMIFHGYDPLSIGARTGIRLYDVFTDRAGGIVEKNGFSLKSADDIGKLISDNLIEPYFPLVDFYVSYYEASNDAAGVKLWTAIRQSLDRRYLKKYGRKFDYARRSTRQRINHVLFGSEEQPQLKKEWNQMTPLEKMQRVIYKTEIPKK